MSFNKLQNLPQEDTENNMTELWAGYSAHILLGRRVLLYWLQSEASYDTSASTCVPHTHIVLSHLHSNPIACIAAQWHSTQSPETSQGLWGQKPYISLGSPRVPSPDYTPPGSDFLTPHSVHVYSHRHLLLCKDKFSLPQSACGYGYRNLSVPGIPSYFPSSLNVQPFFRKE